MIWGLGYRRSNDDLTSSFVYTFQPDRRNDDSYSAFVQDDVHLFSDTLRLTLGAKFEGVSFGYPDGTPDYEKLTIQPNVRLMWLPTADHAFWGAVSGAVRNPSRADHDMRINAGVIPPFVEVNPSPLPALVTILGNRAGESLELSISGQNLLHGHHLEFSRELFEVPSLVQRGVYGKIDWRF